MRTPDAKGGPRWTLPLAAGMTMLVPIPGWDLALERQLLERVIRSECAHAGARVTDGQIARALDLLMRAIFRRHVLGKVLAASWLLGFVGGPAGKLVSAGSAASVSWGVGELLRAHLASGASLDTLEEGSVRQAFLEILRAKAAGLAARGIPGTRAARRHRTRPEP